MAFSMSKYLEQTFKEGSSAYDACDYLTAIAKLLPLANEGHPRAQYLVGDMYRFGHGVEQNAERALHFCKLAADHGIPRAALDVFFLLGTNGGTARPGMQALPKDAVTAQRYLDLAVIRFRELAEAGDMEAMANPGFLFHHGLGVEPDGAEAIRWYTRSFDAGGHGTANNLALLYYEGDVRVRDKAKALYWYMKTKEFNCQCIGISEFESPSSSSDGRRQVRNTIYGYEISIRRAIGMISLTEWIAAVSATEGLQLNSSGASITNPKTGEIIHVPGKDGDAELYLGEHGKWVPAFHWRSESGDVTFPLTREFADPTSVLRATAVRLARHLQAQLIGDSGEIYT